MSLLPKLHTGERRAIYRRLATRCHWHASELAACLQISTRQLERYFRADLGMTPQAWLCRERLRFAFRLLRRGWSPSRVARRLGYRQLAHFSADFKRGHGVPPTRFMSLEPVRPRHVAFS